MFRCAPSGTLQEYLDSIYREQSVFEIVFRRQKESDWIVDIVEDQNGNFETNEISSGEEKNQNVFRLESNREYEATFSFIDDESNRIFIHLEKFTENLQQIEVRNLFFHYVTL